MKDFFPKKCVLLFKSRILHDKSGYRENRAPPLYLLSQMFTNRLSVLPTKKRYTVSKHLISLLSATAHQTTIPYHSLAFFFYSAPNKSVSLCCSRTVCVLEIWSWPTSKHLTKNVFTSASLSSISSIYTS